MPSVSGSPVQRSMLAANVAELESLDVTSLQDGDEAFVQSTGTTYQLVKSATATRTGTFVLYTRQSNPAYFASPGTGRWLYLSGGGGTGIISVATLAARPDPTTLPQGQVVFVQSQQANYLVEAGGVYARQTTYSPVWNAQAVWYLDEVNGNDENSGSLGAPVLTMAELQKRIIAPTVSVTINVLSDVSDQASWDLPVNGVPGLLGFTLKGTRTLSADIAVTASQDQTANLAPQIDLSIALTPGEIIQGSATDTAQQTAVVLGLIAGTLYRTSFWRATNGGSAAPPTAGQHVNRITMTKMNTTVTLGGGDIFWTVQDFDLQFGYTSRFVRLINFITCKFSGNSPPNNSGAGTWNYNGCSIVSTGVMNFGAQVQGSVSSCGIYRAADCTMISTAAMVIQATIFDGGGTLSLRQASYAFIAGVGIFNATGTGLDMRDLSRVFLTTANAVGLFGSGNAVGCDVYDQAQLGNASGLTPTLTGTIELRLAKAATAIPPLSAGLAVPAASALVTWAQLAAGPFNGNAMNYASGCRISNVT